MKVPVYLAPMAGVTDKPFRAMVRKFGTQTLFTEMIGVETLLRGHPVTRKMIDFSGEHHLIAQLVGNEASHLAEAGKIVQDCGVIGIDINMGCPVKKLISNCSGAALMKNPERAADMIHQMVNAVQIPVSAKIRLGWDDTHINAVEFAQMLEQSGVAQITVHGRTKDQGYAGTADWNQIAAVKQAVHIPVIANGDIVDLASAAQALDITQADGLMVGRGALGKPWILQEIETGIRPTFNVSEIVIEHLDRLIEYYGAHGLYVARKHIAWYARGKKEVAPFCQKVYGEKNIKTVKEMIKDFLGEGELT